MKEREALKLALQQKTESHDVDCLCSDCTALDDLDEALAQPEQEPVAWMYPDALCDKACLYLCTKGFTQFPECATPPQRKPLTDEQICRMWNDWHDVLGVGEFALIARAIEAAHGIKE